MCQFLASEVYQPVASIIEQAPRTSPQVPKRKLAKPTPTTTTTVKKKSGVKKSKKPQPPPSPVVQSLMEMGFSRRIIEQAIKSTGSNTNIERLVGWLLEHPDVEVAESESEEEEEEEDITPTGNDLAGDTKVAASVDSDTDSSTTSSDEEGSDLGKEETIEQVYRSREQFSTVDEYAAYVKDHLHVGMTIKCCESYEEVKAGDIGKVTKVRVV